MKPSSYGLMVKFAQYAKCLESSNKSWATFFCVSTLLINDHLFNQNGVSLKSKKKSSLISLASPMDSWQELHTCVIFTNTNLLRKKKHLNTIHSQSTYKLQKKSLNLTYLDWKGLKKTNIQKKLSKGNDFIVSLFSVFCFMEILASIRS